ncbi:PP2C family protein-serine/threonine phosphatase [Terasakiella sp. A23]|uniref:PP2C family protein-serine/threonine phosphatase n=1 Tax=Terasakiella sp. FCG-A23 TaxID=3080561 RepID=UPI002954BF2E|nr:PP2C family protein-serine/threonine phosphatase [Terasakiella sp. A23]MDV7340355.1 PP2C family protein-serine/threonine phosphatase [Terasakiella sp. A23]
MLLRNKLSLITLIFFLIAISGLVFAFNYSTALQQKNFGANASLSQSSLWRKVVDGKIAQLEEVVNDLLQSHNLNIADDDQLNATLQQLNQQGNLPRFELYKNDGNLFYSSEKSYYPAITISALEIQKIANGQATPPAGLIIDSERNTLIITSHKLDNAVLVLAEDVNDALLELTSLTKSESYLINRRGRLLIGTNEVHWKTLSDQVDLDVTNPFQTLEQKDQYYSATLSDVTGAIHPIGYIIGIKEITEIHQQFIQLQWLTYISIAIFILIAATAMWAYLRQSFHPLSEAINILAALSEGTYSQHMNVGTGKDEVSQIGRAIIKFKSYLLRLDRMKRARDKRGHRQSVIIRREMSQLAETLDAQSQTEVMKDLAEIEERLQTAKGENEDTTGSDLAAMGLTLKRLRERIQDQHGKLMDTIEELEEALKSKTAYLALQQELAIGARVQLAMLPDDLPETDYVHISGRMQAAKEVGGDFYDFFYLDENRLAIVIADVSGKGVPASLFMAITRSILRSTASMIAKPSDCIAALNDELCGNNKEELFVTLLYGILDLRDHSFTYTNAGHNPAYHLSDTLAPMDLTGDVALGVMDELEYSQHQIQLSENDAMFFYTDGITEAMNPANEEFGTPAMEAVLAKNLNANVHDLQDEMVKAVDGFADSAPQADDITCVAVRLKAKKSS